MTPRSEDAVSSVVGTILMLAVTVSVFGGLSLLVLNEIRSSDAPPEAELAFLQEGNRAVLVHRGGEGIDLDDGYLLVNVNGAGLRFPLDDLAVQTADGKTWRIGESICVSGPDPPDPARPCLLDNQLVLGVAVVAGGGVLVDEGERGSDAGACPLDNVPPTPTLPWTFEPADLLSTSSGPVTVRIAATDDCSGVDDSAAAAPELFYRIDDGSGPAYLSLGDMASDGPGQWSGVVPAQSWNLLGGQTLQVYATGMRDTRGNQAGATAVGSKTIDAVPLVTYVTGATATTGTVGPLGPAQDDADADAATSLTEGATAVPPATVGPTKLSGTSQTSAGVTSPENVLASDDARTELADLNDAVEVTGFDLPSNADTVTAVVIGFEGLREGTTGAPQVRLDYKIGSGAYSLGTPLTVTSTTDAEHTRTLAGSFTVAQLESMTVRAILSTNDNRDPFVDHVFVTVTYTTAATTTYSLDVTLDFAGAADGASEALELSYQTSGDTFDVQVWDGGAYVSVGTLSSAGSFGSFSHTLTAAQYNGGAPRVRLVDLTPAGTTQGTLQLDYARVVTV